MKIEKCPFCGKQIAEITNCNDLEECRHFEKCPATEPYVCVVCNMHEGGCGASSGYYDSEAKAIAAWNRRAEQNNTPLALDEIISRCTPKAAELLKTGLLGAVKVCAVEEITPKTNADRIRSMNDEELAEYIFDLGNGSEYCYGHCAYQDDCNAEGIDHDTCIKGVIDWLQQPVKEELT